MKKWPLDIIAGNWPDNLHPLDFIAGNTFKVVVAIFFCLDT